MEQTKDIEIVINYKESFLYQNEKGSWMVLSVILNNLTTLPQTIGYDVTPSGKLCSHIETAPPKGSKGMLLFPPKTKKATIETSLFTLESGKSKHDILVITDFNDKEDWCLKVNSEPVLIDKKSLETKTKLE